MPHAGTIFSLNIILCTTLLASLRTCPITIQLESSAGAALEVRLNSKAPPPRRIESTPGPSCERLFLSVLVNDSARLTSVERT